MVASDGAGSAKHSAVGSEIACNTFLEEVAGFLDGGGRVADIDQTRVDLWFDAIVGRLHLQAEGLDCPVRELACTLVAAVVGETSAVFVQVGDGGIVVRRGEIYEPATWPAAGDYVNTTFFVTDDHALDNLRVVTDERPVDEVAVFTDGVQMLALHFATKTAHAPFFEPMFSRLRQEHPGDSAEVRVLVEEYLASDVINSRTDDDKTIVLASRLPRSSESVDAPTA